MEYLFLILSYMFLGFFWGTPVALFIWFIYSFVRFIKRDKDNPEECHTRKKWFVFSGIVSVIDIAFTVLVIIGMNELEYM